uniref:RPW8 domain-containing protein n=2 Tax=Populus trichocarpa TaxID=3694 RepID=A0A2K1ZNW8_POPTR
MAGQVVVSAVAGAEKQLPVQAKLEAPRGNVGRHGSNYQENRIFNAELYQPKQLERLKGLMAEGNDLVNKCSKIHKYNFFKKSPYNMKLLNLEKDIRDHISSVLQLQEVGDTKGVSSGVRQLSDQFGKLSMTLSNGSRVDSSKSYSNITLAGSVSI